MNLRCRFPDLLRELDRDRATLGVRSYGLSVTTMEEVFLNVSQAAQAAHAAASPATTANGTSGGGAVKEADVRGCCSHMLHLRMERCYSVAWHTDAAPAQLWVENSQFRHQSIDEGLTFH